MWRRWFRWRRVTVFLSYRVDPDQPLVEALYRHLVRLGVRVWWDVECLKPGQLWEDGFADGLFGARVFVPILSKAALANFAQLDAGSSCDNVLLEFALALARKASGELCAIYPVFVGELEPASGEHGDFFRGGGLPDAADVIVESVDAKVRGHLTQHQARRGGRGCCMRQRHSLAPSGAPGRTQQPPCEARCSPQSALQEICRHQGGFVRGARDEVIAGIARTILGVVKDVAAGRTISEASGEDVKGGGKSTGRTAAMAPPVCSGRWWAARARRFLFLGHPSGEASADGRKAAAQNGPASGATPRRPHPRASALQPTPVLRAASAPVPTKTAPSGLLFSPTVAGDDVDNDATLNPILVHKAREERARARREKEEALRARMLPSSAQQSGGLRRLHLAGENRLSNWEPYNNPLPPPPSHPC